MQRSRSKPFRAPPSRALCWLAIGFWLAACSLDDETGGVDRAPPWPSGDLVAVAAPTPDRVLVASRDGRILRSVDGGRSWSRARTPATSVLADLIMVDAERGWAVGPGTILTSEDSGAHWERQRLPGPAEDWPLVAVAAVDGDRAVALAEDGRWLTTTDGGGLWRASGRDREEAGVPGPKRLADVDCRSVAPARCWAVGDRVVAIDPGSDGFRVREIADAAGLPAFPFRFGGVELARDDAERLRATAGRLARRAVEWQVEAFVTREERRRYAEDQDPSALFDRIEARAGEVVGQLEAVGIPNDRITVVGSPPWGYEELLDDDPGFLARYWAQRLAPAPSVSVRAEEAVDLRTVVVTESGLLAGDAEGRLFVGEGEDGPLTVGEGAAPHGLLAMAPVGPRWVAVGRQGGIFILRSGRRGLEVAPASVGAGGALFETLRSVSFAPGSDVGWAVGNAGRIVTTGDGGHGWMRLEPPKGL